MPRSAAGRLADPRGDGRNDGGHARIPDAVCQLHHEGTRLPETAGAPQREQTVGTGEVQPVGRPGSSGRLDGLGARLEGRWQVPAHLEGGQVAHCVGQAPRVVRGPGDARSAHEQGHTGFRGADGGEADGKTHLRSGEGVPVAAALRRAAGAGRRTRPWLAHRPASDGRLRGRWPEGAVRDRRPRRPGGTPSVPGRGPGPAPRPVASGGLGTARRRRSPRRWALPNSSYSCRATSACRVVASTSPVSWAYLAAPREIRARSAGSLHRASADSRSRSASTGAPSAAARAPARSRRRTARRVTTRTSVSLGEEASTASSRCWATTTARSSLSSICSSRNAAAARCLALRSRRDSVA